METRAFPYWKVKLADVKNFPVDNLLYKFLNVVGAEIVGHRNYPWIAYPVHRVLLVGKEGHSPTRDRNLDQP